MSVSLQSVGSVTGASVRATRRGAAPGVDSNTPTHISFLSWSRDRLAQSPPPNCLRRSARSALAARHTSAT